MSPLLAIAFRNVRRNRRRSLITFSAVFLALAVMVSLRGFINGMVDSVRDSTVNGQTGALQVHRRGFLKSVNGVSLDLDVPADELARRRGEWRAPAPHYTGGVMAKYAALVGSASEGAVTTGPRMTAGLG